MRSASAEKRAARRCLRSRAQARPSGSPCDAPPRSSGESARPGGSSGSGPVITRCSKSMSRQVRPRSSAARSPENNSIGTTSDAIPSDFSTSAWISLGVRNRSFGRPGFGRSRRARTSQGFATMSPVRAACPSRPRTPIQRARIDHAAAPRAALSLMPRHEVVWRDRADLAAAELG